MRGYLVALKEIGWTLRGRTQPECRSSVRARVGAGVGAELAVVEPPRTGCHSSVAPARVSTVRIRRSLWRIAT
jgi:hypothetical protein